MRAVICLLDILFCCHVPAKLSFFPPTSPLRRGGGEWCHFRASTASAVTSVIAAANQTAGCPPRHEQYCSVSVKEEIWTSDRVFTRTSTSTSSSWASRRESVHRSASSGRPCRSSSRGKRDSNSKWTSTWRSCPRCPSSTGFYSVKSDSSMEALQKSRLGRFLSFLLFIAAVRWLLELKWSWRETCLGPFEDLVEFSLDMLIICSLGFCFSVGDLPRVVTCNTSYKLHHGNLS